MEEVDLFHFAELAASAGTAYSACWIVHAPWAHPIWHSYAIHLVDLNTDIEGKPAQKLREDVTHEMTLWALDPDPNKQPVIGESLKDWDLNGCMLQPANYGYQFVADSDEAARNRIQALVDKIEKRLLSPDTDFRWDWDRVFKDAQTLLVRG